jgi:hypothetical protein
LLEHGLGMWVGRRSSHCRRGSSRLNLERARGGNSREQVLTESYSNEQGTWFHYLGESPTLSFVDVRFIAYNKNPDNNNN